MNCEQPNCAERYAHIHCANCGLTMLAVGGGGDDGRGIAGYEDDLGAAATNGADGELCCPSCATV